MNNALWWKISYTDWYETVENKEDYLSLKVCSKKQGWPSSSLQFTVYCAQTSKHRGNKENTIKSMAL